jgi:TolB protein
VYTNIEEGEWVELFVTRADGSEDFRITGAAGFSIQPVWSLDSRLIAYLFIDPRGPGFEDDEVNIWVMDVSSGEARAVTTAGVAVGSALAWSPDSRYLTFSADVNGEPDIFRLDVDSGQLANLTQRGDWDAFPAWSPDGEQIAFVSDREGLDSIWVMSPDGSRAQNLTGDAGNWENVTPAWSPDGSRIAFYRWSAVESHNAQAGPPGLWIMSADGSRAHALVEFSSFQHFEPPVWSPDGTMIAYADPGLPEADIWVAFLDGRDPINVSNLPGTEGNVSWSPDSQALIFTQGRNEEIHLWLATPDARILAEIGSGDQNGYAHWSTVNFNWGDQALR